MSHSGTAYHPELGQLMTWNAEELSSDPDTQVEQTIRRMRQNALEDSRSAPIQRDAAAIQAQGLDPLSGSFWQAKNRLQFRQDEDIAGPFRRFLDDDVVEVMIRPRDVAVMDSPQEDCDGFSQYVAALAIAQGADCRFVTVAADEREAGRFSHVYVACKDPCTGERVPLDASHGPYPGWECTESGQVTRMKEWPITGPDWSELLLIAGVLFALACLWKAV